jgi:hypothetical protein
MTGILISGKMSVGVLIADNGPMMRMKIARTTKV